MATDIRRDESFRTAIKNQVRWIKLASIILFPENFGRRQLFVSLVSLYYMYSARIKGCVNSPPYPEQRELGLDITQPSLQISAE